MLLLIQKTFQKISLVCSAVIKVKKICLVEIQNHQMSSELKKTSLLMVVYLEEPNLHLVYSAIKNLQLLLQDFLVIASLLQIYLVGIKKIKSQSCLETNLLLYLVQMKISPTYLVANLLKEVVCLEDKICSQA